MADNYVTDAGAGGNTYRSDDIGGVHWPYVKLAWGTDGTGTICDTANPLPCVLTAGSAAIGKLAANDGVDIGDVTINNAGGVEVIQDTAADLNVTEASAADIKTAVELIDDAIAGTEMQVDLVDIAGVATEATLAAVAGYLDTEVAALVMAIELLDNCISGNEAQVDVITSALPTGAATETTLNNIYSNTTTIVGTVRTLGTDTYTEGSTQGQILGVVRNDDLATLADTDNETAPLQVDSQGALYVNQAAAELKSDSGVAAGGAPGTEDMIAAVAGKKLLVVAMSLVATSTTTNTIYVDNVDNDLYGNSGNGIALSLDADADTIPGFVLQYNPAGWFKTDAVNEAVTLNTSAAQDIIWSISWIETD